MGCLRVKKKKNPNYNKTSPYAVVVTLSSDSLCSDLAFQSMTRQSL